MPTRTEAQTRKTLIDPAITRAGWDLDDANQVRFEIPVDEVSPAAWQVCEERLSRLRAAEREAMRQAEHLFQTLLHQAVEGEV